MVEREDVTEKGAIVMAALLLEQEGKRITRVVQRRGGRFDYYVSGGGKRENYVLEVGGTVEGSFTSLINKKLEQVGESPMCRPPLSKVGLAAATRFAPERRTGLAVHGGQHA